VTPKDIAIKMREGTSGTQLYHGAHFHVTTQKKAVTADDNPTKRSSDKDFGAIVWKGFYFCTFSTLCTSRISFYKPV